MVQFHAISASDWRQFGWRIVSLCGWVDDSQLEGLANIGETDEMRRWDSPLDANVGEYVAPGLITGVVWELLVAVTEHSVCEQMDGLLGTEYSNQRGLAGRMSDGRFAPFIKCEKTDHFAGVPRD